MMELLVVLAVIATLSALLFPAVIAAKDQARRTVCVVNFGQVSMATSLYLQDYDDRYMPANYQVDSPTSQNDKTWVQLLLPYVNNLKIFRCPADVASRSAAEGTFDESLSPVDSAERFYDISMRSNLGYNYLYLAPPVKEGGVWQVQPRMYTQLSNASQTLLFVDTVHEVVDGRPQGGGNYLVIPPCRYEVVNDTKVDTFLATVAGPSRQVFAAHAGWTPQESSTYVFGGAWPWHSGTVTVVRADGSAKVVKTADLAGGCEVKDQWGGFISDRGRYLWDFQP